MLREGNSITRPPLLDGSSCCYWKNRMQIFLMNLGPEAWFAVQTLYQPPVREVRIDAGDGGNAIVTFEPAPIEEYTPKERSQLQGNTSALNAIFSAVDETQYRMISTCTTAYDAWHTLQSAHEGSADVRATKLQRIESAFDRMMMQEDESISAYYARFKDLVNQAHLLGLVYDESKLVRKMLRTVSRKFIPKVSTLEELDKVHTMTLEGLVGTLRTYEMNYIEDAPTSKSIAFKAVEDCSEISEEEKAFISKKL